MPQYSWRNSYYFRWVIETLNQGPWTDEAMGLRADRKHSSKLQASLEPFPWLWLLPAHHSLGEQKITSFHFLRGVKLSPPHLSLDSSGCDLRIQVFFFFFCLPSPHPLPPSLASFLLWVSSCSSLGEDSNKGLFRRIYLIHWDRHQELLLFRSVQFLILQSLVNVNRLELWTFLDRGKGPWPNRIFGSFRLPGTMGSNPIRSGWPFSLPN